jgi:hypothetical protein
MMMAEMKTSLHLPDALFRRVRQLAVQERRSINAEVVILLEEAFLYRTLIAELHPKRTDKLGTD